MASLMGVMSKAAKSFVASASISVDNWTFKCFYKLTTTVCVACSVAATARQFFGAPIICDAGTVSWIDFFKNIVSVVRSFVHLQ